MKRLLAALAAPALAAALVADLDRPTDALELTNGKKIEGHVLALRPDEVVMLVDTRQETYAKDKVERVRSPIPHLREFGRKLGATSVADAAANMQLAAWCEQHDMPYEADYLRWRAVAADWNHAPAHEELEHRQRSGEWQVKAGKSWVGRDRFEKDQKRFKSAFEVSTALVRVRGNVPLGRLCDMVADWTRFYDAFFELFGDLIDMPHASQWMAVHVHGDDDSFPRAGSNDPVYFLAAENRVVVDTTRMPSATELRRVFLSQVLYSTYRNAENGRGGAPAWLAEALGVYISTALGKQGPPDPSRVLSTDVDHFALHAEARDPETLSRILNSGADDLRNVPGHELRLAQAYTLLDWCLNADDGAHREAFIAFVKGTMQGHGSPTHFQDALGVENRRFGDTWQAWAATRAEQRARQLAAPAAAGDDEQ